MSFLTSLLRRNRTDIFIILWLGILPLLFFWQVTVGDRTLIPADILYQYQPWASYREEVGAPAVPQNGLVADLLLENYPWKQFIRNSLANGELPLWNPYIFAGVPFLATGQHSALYPFSIIYYVMPLEKAYGWFTVSQLWLAGTMMYLFMRCLSVRRFGGLIAANAFSMSAFFLASVVFPMIIAGAAWLPFLLLMVEFTIQQKSLFGRRTVIPWMALGAAGLGMTIFAGHIEFVYYALLVMGFWAAARLLTNRNPELKLRAETVERRGISDWLRMRIKPAAALLAMVVLGIGIGAAQFIPLLEVGGLNFREGRTPFDTVRSYAFPIRHAAVFLMPNIYGSPAQHEYWDVFSGTTQPVDWQVQGQHITNTGYPGGKNYVEGACYVGLLTLILAVIALLNARFERSAAAKIDPRAPYRMLFAIMAVIALSFVFGTITYALLYYGFPGINQLHSPFRWVFPLTLCLAALAGYGAEAVLKARSDLQSFTARLVKWIGVGAVGIGGIVVVALILSRLLFDQLQAPLETIYQRLAGANYVFPSVREFYSVSFTPVALFALFLIGSGIALLLTRLRRGGIGQFALIGVLTLDLVVATAGFNPAADPKWLQFEPPAITWLKQQNPQEWRFIAVEQNTHTMNANIGWLYGLQDVAGYDSMIPKQYVEYMRRVQPQDMLMYNRIAPIFADRLDAIDWTNLNALSVKYIISEVTLDTIKFSHLNLVFEDRDTRIYENTDYHPRIFTAPISDKEPVLISVSNNQLVAQITIPPAQQLQGDIFFENQTSVLQILVTDQYFPGWRAFIRPVGTSEDAEQEVEVEPFVGRIVNLVDYPPGDYIIRFRYSPQSFQIGAFGSFISGIVILFMLMVWAWSAFYRESEDAAGSTRRFAKNSLAPIFLNLFNRGIDFAFAAIMLRVLGPGAAGTYYYAVVIFGWFDTLTNFGLNLLLTREVAHDRSEARRYLLNSSVLRLGLAGAGVPFLILFLLARQALPDPLDATGLAAIALLYVGLVPNSISYGLTALFYAFEKAELPAAISTVSAILKAVFGLAALLLGWGVVGLAGVSILINLITLVILVVQAQGLLRTAEAKPAQIERPLMRHMINVGFPLMLNNLLAGLFFKIDVTLLEPLQGRGVVGTYSTAYKWVDALGVVPSLFTMALLPIMSRQAREDKAGLERTYTFAVKLLVSLALPVAVITTFLATGLIGLLGGSGVPA
ncbi:MAG: oligosaccharide flippase family protein [Anaerolineae bacterium]